MPFLNALFMQELAYHKCDVILALPGGASSQLTHMVHTNGFAHLLCIDVHLLYLIYYHGGQAKYIGKSTIPGAYGVQYLFNIHIHILYYYIYTNLL